MTEPHAEQAASDSEHRKERKRGRFSLLAEFVIVIVGALVISAALRAFVFQTFIIPSGSMENTLLIGDRVVAMQVVDFKRGDVVVFEDAEQWLNEPTKKRALLGQVGEALGVLPSTSENYLIKRVIGLPGDRVRCCDNQGRLTVNGVPLHEEDYLFSEGGMTVAPAEVPFEVVVPAGRIFVMGDHRNASGDSRCHLGDLAIDGQPRGMTAFIPLDRVVGPAKLIMAPLNRLRSLDIPPTFATIPAPSEPAPAVPFISPEGVGC